MRMKYFRWLCYFFIVLVLVCLAGCSTARQAVIDTSIENVKNAEAVREVSLNCLSVWPIQSGFIKGALGSRINELPLEVIEAIDALDTLAAQTEQTDEELGRFLGLKILLLKSVVKVALEKYAPDVIELLPLVF